MNGSNPNNLDGWYRFFLILGLLGLIDVGTNTLVQSGDFGVVTVALYSILNIIFPVSVSAKVSAVASIILGFSIIYLLIAWSIKTRMKKGGQSVEQKQ